MGVVVFLAAGFLAPTALSLAADAQVDRIEKAFTDWLSHHAVPNASLVIVRDGEIVGSVGRGTYDPRKVVPVASLSKAITGICISKLVNAGKLRYDTNLGEALKERFSRHPPKDKRVQVITLAQLLTHTSGITKDPSQGAALTRFRPYSQLSMSKQLDHALGVPLGQIPGSKYTYNNVNYAALGAVIEVATGEAYETYCGREVLEAAGVSVATLNEKCCVMGAYGGWRISAEDYARFLDYFDSSNSATRAQFAQWPKVGVGAGASYSLGVFMRIAGGSYNFWHFGSWQSNDPKASFGAYFAVWHQGIRVVAAYSPNVSETSANELDAKLYQAAFQ